MRWPAGAQRGVQAESAQQARGAADERIQAAEWAALCGAAQALDARRRALGCSLAKLAEYMGMSATTVGRALRTDGAVARPDAAGRQRLRQRLAALRRALDEYQTQATPPAPHMQTTQPLHPRQTNRPVRAPQSKLPDQSTQTQQANAGRVAVATHPQLPTYRVLIVEDDPDVVAIYRLSLAEAATDDADHAANYVVTVVGTASACVAALRAAAASARPYDLLLMDLGLRDIHADLPPTTSAARSGREAAGGAILTTLIHTDAPLPAARLIVSGMAPYHLQRAQHEMKRLGAAFLPKPFDIDALLATVRSLCAHHERQLPGQ